VAADSFMIMRLIPMKKFILVGGGMLAKFISACGGIQYIEISDRNLYDGFSIPVTQEMDYIPFVEETPMYLDMMIRTFRYDSSAYDELHRKRMPVYKEYIKKWK
jgi:hypothetical protein